MPDYAVIYSDPKRRKRGSGCEHTLHAPSCGDVTRARRHGDNLVGVVEISAPDVAKALLIAQYQQEDLIGNDGADLGGVDIAPCLGSAA